MLSNNRLKSKTLPLFLEAIPVLSAAERAELGNVPVPTSPDTSSLWSDKCGPGGWSAKMFLHQMMSTLRPGWDVLDTERLLSEQTQVRLQAKTGSGISLSDVLKPPNCANLWSYRNLRQVKFLLQRALRRDRSFRVLLHGPTDMIPAIVTFGTGSLESWTVKRGKDLPA